MKEEIINLMRVLEENNVTIPDEFTISDYIKEKDSPEFWNVSDDDLEIALEYLKWLVGNHV